MIYSFLSQLLVPVALLVYGSHLVMSGRMHPERLIAFMLYQGSCGAVSNLRLHFHVQEQRVGGGGV